MSLAPVPSESATCANCAAPLVADQRYCLSCGQPCSPVRLAFLDVLQAERPHPQAVGGPFGSVPVAYAPPLEPTGSPPWLRRHSPLFGVLSVLLMAMIVGLLVGHWVTQSRAPGPQVLKVEGLTGAAPVASAATTTPTTSTAASATPSAPSKSTAKAETEEVAKEAKAEKVQAAKVEKAKTIKPSSTKLKKLGASTGRKHEEEVNALGSQPIETGG
ncbi:MAG TPA: hypothetical protein VES97_05940 [Solirubrobacteraceae bacterium]|nr:hypothetical protein [Solirubrobacteraceae bacterium]